MGSSVEQIKERLSVADVIGSYVKLEKSGSNYKARCPFHNEKTPSFFVSPARNSYYCFGCQAKGDIFSFVEQFEGLDFVGALKVLAQRAGVELVRENPKVKSEKDRLYAVLERATEFFEKSLTSDEEAKSYLSKRGVKEETTNDWRLGFAPDSWRSLHDYLLKEGFNVDEMLKAGLIKKSDKQGGGFYDGFRGRVMFPIFDSSERVIGFSGRLLPRLDDGKMGKYINSPETILFNKSRVLYGLNKAKLDVRKRDYSIMVEGQMDLIMSHQAGFTNTVAVSGTALSSDIKSDDAVTNLGLLTRLSKNIILAFDSDEAGFKASGRNAKIALSLGMDVKVAKMPEGEDPADIILRNGEEWKKIIKNSKHVIDFSLETLLEKNSDARKLGKEIERVVLPYVASLTSAIDQSHFITKIAKAAKIQENALWEEMKKVQVMESTVPRSGTVPQEAISRPLSNRRSVLEKKLLGILYWQESKGTLMVKPKGKLTTGFPKGTSAEEFESLREKLESIIGKESLVKLEERLLDNKNTLIFEAELAYDSATNLPHEIDELLINLEIEVIDEKLSEAMKHVYGDQSERNKEVMESVGVLSKRKQELKNRRARVDK